MDFNCYIKSGFKATFKLKQSLNFKFKLNATPLHTQQVEPIYSFIKTLYRKLLF